MTNLRNPSPSLLLGLAVGALAFTLPLGCGEKAPEPAVQSSLPERSYSDEPEEAPAPRRLTVADLNLAPGVEYPTPRIPTDAALARSIADLAGAIKAGDATTLEPLLTPSGQAVLASLVQSGGWDGATEMFSAVRVCTVLEEGETASIGLGVQDARGVYLTGWTAISAGGQWKFEGLALEPVAASSLSALDGSALTPAPLPIAGAPVIEAPAARGPVEDAPAAAPAETTRARPRG